MESTLARIDAIFQAVHAQGASDLHISTGAPPMIRRHGEMHPIEYQELTRELTEMLLFEIMGEKERAQIMAALDCVDIVAVFPEETPMRLIEQIQPDILVKGGDYEMHEVVGRDFVESHGGRVELVPIVEGFSTSDFVKRIVEKYRDS